MRRRPNSLSPLSAFLVPALAAAALWAAWLGWDQHREVHPDGSSTGPYEAWQVVGLVVTLLVPVFWAASRGRVLAPALGVAAGLAVACAYDWSDDGSGLFMVGVVMVLVGSLAVTAAVAGVIAAVSRTDTSRGPGA